MKHIDAAGLATISEETHDRVLAHTDLHVLRSLKGVEIATLLDQEHPLVQVGGVVQNLLPEIVSAHRSIDSLVIQELLLGADDRDEDVRVTLQMEDGDTDRFHIVGDIFRRMEEAGLTVDPKGRTGNVSTRGEIEFYVTPKKPTGV